MQSNFQLPNFQLLGPAHLCILAAVPSLAAILAAVQRKLAHGSRGLRIGLACVIVLDAAVYYGFLIAHGQLTFPDHLPLELCDASLCLIIIALFTLNKTIFDLAYYGALAGATMALLTPNLWEPFPSFSTIQFFVDHGLIVVGVLYLVWSKQARPRPGSVARAMLAVNIYAACVGTIDYFYKTDYMYLRAKPPNASLLDLLGPWPCYIAAAEVVACCVFLLLYLPFRKSNRTSQHHMSPLPTQPESNAL
jgi:hypothetical integral membrane protein (TIGR02206 family)